VQVLPEDEEKKTGLCPICDFRVPIDAKKCPECKADLTVFGVKTDTEEAGGIDIPEYEESLEELLGKIGEKDEKKEHELFEELMAAVDKTGALSAEEGEEAPEVTEEKPQQEVAEEAQEGAVMFECPLCNTLVNEDAESCPGCGAIFATGEEEVPQAPETRSEIGEYEGPWELAPTAEEEPQEVEEPPAEEPIYTEPEAPQQEIEEEQEVEEPKKGIFGFMKRKDEVEPAHEIGEAPIPQVEEAPPAAPPREEKALHRQLARSVSDVKPLLTTARKEGINVLEGRKLIDQAITAGKKRDFQTAIDLVERSKKIIENSITEQAIDFIQTTQSKIEALLKAGGEVSELENMQAKVQLLLNDRRFSEAIELAKRAAENAENAVLEMKAEMKKREPIGEEEKNVEKSAEELVELIKMGEEVKVNVKQAKTFLTQARVAIKKNEISKAENLLTQAKEDFLKELPKQLTTIISSSKPVLYKAKMQGVDIRPSIKLLKEASTALKLNNYLDALDAIKRYRAGMTQYME